MNRPALVLIVAVLVSVAVDVAPAQMLDLERIEIVADSVAHVHVEENAAVPGMTVAVAKDGEIVFIRGYGKADVEMDVAAGPETVYKIGSLTKQFTAAAVMRLIEAGKISPDDSITKYLPDYPAQGHLVTVRHLLNHTSGIKDYAELGIGLWMRDFRLDLSEQEMIELFAKEPFDFSPGQEHRYNNSGYYLLGVIIEKVTGVPYGDYVEREMLQPLGLSSIVYCPTRRVVPNRAEGYEYERNGTLVNAHYISMQVYGAAGGLCSTAGDLLRWTNLLHDSQVVSAASLAQMTAPTVLASGDTITYGLGLDLARLGDHQKIAHGGNVVGFSSYLVHYPSAGLTIAVLTNADEARPGRMEEALARTAHGLELSTVLNLPLTAEDLARYEGTYIVGTGPRAVEVRVFGEDGQLRLKVAGGRVSKVYYQGDHVFIPVLDDKARLVFAIENGRAESFTLHQGGRATQAIRKQ